ncbi:MAG: RNA 2',3'-cyclic phosphodiesterase [Methanocorpusculum sp.]|nr:RNA 2',3'-cyclic phosphodiesterase [Methanocorpusculum sp.]
MVRLFIAVEPSNEIQTKIAEAGETLKGAGRLSFAKTEQMHITLKFLGEVEENKIPKIEEALKQISGKPYRLTASKVSSFGRPPRVIKAEVNDGGESAKLAEQLEPLLANAGFPREDKKFSPHITIARVKEYSPSLEEKISSLHDSEFGSCTINEIALKKSILTPSGAIYDTIYSVKL